MDLSLMEFPILIGVSQRSNIYSEFYMIGDYARVIGFPGKGDPGHYWRNTLKFGEKFPQCKGFCLHVKLNFPPGLGIRNQD